MSVDLADRHRKSSTRRPILESVPGLSRTREAVVYAAQLHAGQLRAEDGAPFIVHPLEVACLLYDAGASDQMIAAGLLHDVIEKTDADAEDLSARFGSSIASLVLALTEDQRIIGYDARKAALCEQVVTAGRDAQMVFAADKISKVRELGCAYARSGDHSARSVRLNDRRLAYYRRCLQLLEELLAGSSLVIELRTKVERAQAVSRARSTAAG